jgi:hypothetical protein
MSNRGLDMFARSRRLALKGLARKSKAPHFMAFMVAGMLPCPVTKTMGVRMFRES